MKYLVLVEFEVADSIQPQPLPEDVVSELMLLRGGEYVTNVVATNVATYKYVELHALTDYFGA